MTGPSAGDGSRRIGVEEEFLLVDAATGRPKPAVEEVAPRAGAEKELHRAQVEAVTEPCADLAEVAAQVTARRADVATAAATHGASVLASGTHPGPLGEEGRLLTIGSRYERIGEANALIAEEQLICGCHIHVSVSSQDEAVAVANRARRWLSILLALSANSPFWDGRDSGYASYRTEVWWRWPSAGPPGEFRGPDEYWDLVDSLVRAGVILDRAMAYWDIRPSDRYNTVELRVSDVLLEVSDVVVLAGLWRGLVETCAMAGPVSMRPEMLRAASWKAARTGLTDTLIDPADGSSLAAREAVNRMVELVSPALRRSGDLDEVTSGVARIFERGNGADRQRAAHREGGLAAVIALASVTSDG